MSKQTNCDNQVLKQAPNTALSYIEKYIACVYEPGDIVEIRCFPKKESPARTKQYWLESQSLTQKIAEMQRLNDAGYGIYFGVNPRNKIGGSKTDDVSVARCLFADFDDNATVESIESLLDGLAFPKPTLTIFSGKYL